MGENYDFQSFKVATLQDCKHATIMNGHDHPRLSKVSIHCLLAAQTDICLHKNKVVKVRFTQCEGFVVGTIYLMSGGFVFRELGRQLMGIP